MYSGKLIFSQVMDLVPLHTFRHCVARYQGNHNVRSFTCLDQYLCMAFAQLTYRKSLRDIEACLRSQQQKLYHMGIGGTVARSNLADANEWRDWRIYADFAHALIITARTLYSNEPVGIDLQQTVYALDATTIDLCLSMFPWATFRQTKAAIKLHTLLDMRGSIPTFICIFDGTMHDVNILDALPREPGAFYVMDRGYLDYARLHTISQATGFFVIRAKSNLGECGQNSNLDRRVGLCAGRHTQKAAQYPGEALHNFTNSERLSFRKNSVITVTCRNKHGAGKLGFPKPVDFIHLTVGQ